MSKKALLFSESGIFTPTFIAETGYVYGAPSQPISFEGAGETAAAPTTSFFGLVPDQFTLLCPGHYGSSSAGFDNITPARYPSQYTIYNTAFDGGTNQNSVSLGANTTAPDGTTNVATKLVESNANSVHYIGALHGHGNYFNSNVGLGPVFRIGVFAKAAERSRLCVKIVQSNGVGATIVFDLAGVQVGVAPTFGSGWSLVGTPSIYSFGNGWCCCWYDVKTGDNTAVGPWYIVKLMLDANTGTAAENTSYAGNGTSGLYVWNTVMLPPKAWAINNQSFFDDFDTGLPTVDTGKTYVPGFNWYLSQPKSPPAYGINVPNPGWFDDTPANRVTQVNPSTVRLLPGTGPPDAAGGLRAILATFYGNSTLQPFPQGYVGRWFQPPYVQEIKGKSVNAGGTGGGLLGSWSLELTTDSGTTSFTQQARLPRAGEMEWSENQGGSYIPRATPTWNWASAFGSGPAGDNLNPFSCLPAPIKWDSITAWPQFTIVSYLGNLYANLSGTSTAGNNPVTNSPAEWSAFNGTNPDTTVFSSNFSANFQALTPYDPTQYHTYTGIWLPGEDTADNIGWMGFFIDGVCFAAIRALIGSFSGGSVLTYYGGLPSPAFDTWRTMEGAHWPIFISIGVGSPVDFDYVKVLQ